jgi:hypothetical protein
VSKTSTVDAKGSLSQPAAIVYASGSTPNAAELAAGEHLAATAGWTFGVWIG